MTKKTIKRFTPIKVTWVDTSYDARQFTVENVSNRKGIYDLETVGYLVHEDDLRMVIAMQKCIDSRDEVRHICWIPKVSIKEIKILEDNDLVS